MSNVSHSLIGLFFCCRLKKKKGQLGAGRYDKNYHIMILEGGATIHGMHHDMRVSQTANSVALKNNAVIYITSTKINSLYFYI